MESTWQSAGQLPSDDKVYKGRTVSFRPYQLAEVRSASRSVIPPRERMNMFAKGMRCSDDTDPLDLTLSDFLYVAALRVMLTMGEGVKYSFSATCECGKGIFTTVEGQEFEFNDLELDFPRQHKIGKKTVTASPITARQYKDEQPEDEYDMLAISLGMSAEDIRTSIHIFDIETIDSAMAHSVKPLSCKCTCGKVTKVGVSLLGKDGTNSLVVPFRPASDPA